MQNHGIFLIFSFSWLPNGAKKIKGHLVLKEVRLLGPRFRGQYLLSDVTDASQLAITLRGTILARKLTQLHVEDNLSPAHVR